MKHLKKLVMVLFAIVALQSQADCAPMNTVTTSEFGVMFDNPYPVFKAPANGGSITVIGDVLKVEPEKGDTLLELTIFNEQDRLVYSNNQLGDLGREDAFEVILSSICKVGNTYCVSATTSGGTTSFEFTYTPKD